LAVLALFVAPGMARASRTQPTAVASLDRSAGPPTTTVSVTGTRFGDQEAVDIYFDTTDEALASTDARGSFSDINVTVPASALPGVHWVTLVGRRTGRSAQARFNVRTNWSQFGFNASNSRFNPFENVLSPSNVAGLGPAWIYRVGEGKFDGVDSSPAVVNGVVYVGSGSPIPGPGADHGTMWAFNASTGEVLWSFDAGGPTYPGGDPAVVDGVVYFGSGNGKLYALDARTGAELWSFDTGAGPFINGSPAVAKGVVYVPGGDTLYALDAKTGAKLWSYHTNGLVASPTVFDGVVMFGDDAGNSLIGLRASDGVGLWSFDAGGAVDSKPTVAYGNVYFGTGNGKVYAIVFRPDRIAGRPGPTPVWSYDTLPSQGVWTSPAVVNGVVYVSSKLGPVTALNAFIGDKLWATRGSYGGLSSPAVANGVVYAGAINGVEAVDAATGQKLWFYRLLYGQSSSPAVVNGHVYIGGEDNNMYAFDVANNTNQTVARPRESQLKPNRSLRASN
jgi:outer membrane protein assembly factor BamB